MSEALQLPFVRPVLPIVSADGARPYQREAADAIRAALERQRSTMAVMPTGTGKTFVGSLVARDWPGRVFWLAHVRELNAQARGALERVTGEPVGLEQAADYAGGERIVVASVQTLVRNRGTRFEAPSLVIVDECHHATASSYLRILERWPAAKVLGLTATPDRTDAEALGQVFESVCYRLSIEDAIDDGWLVPVNHRVLSGITVDISKVKTKLGDLDEKGLDEAMAEHTAQCAAAIAEECDRHKTIAFTTRVARSKDLVACLERLGVRAAHIDGTTESDERTATVEAFRRSDRYQVLANVGIATEGFDAPDVSKVALLRCTKSHALFVQMAGRGLRPLPGILDGCRTAAERKAAIAASAKPSCTLLSLRYLPGKHVLTGVVDMLGGRYTIEERKRARERLDEGEETSVELALEDARKEIEERERKKAARAAKIAEEAANRKRLIEEHIARYSATWSEVDPFAAFGVSDPERDPKTAISEPAEPCKPELRRWLMWKLGTRLPDQLTQRQAEKLRRTVFMRQNRGLSITMPSANRKPGGAVPGQVEWLRRMNVDASKMNFEEAAAEMRRIQRLQRDGFAAARRQA